MRKTQKFQAKYTEQRLRQPEKRNIPQDGRRETTSWKWGELLSSEWEGFLMKESAGRTFWRSITESQQDTKQESKSTKWIFSHERGSSLVDRSALSGGR